MTSICHLPIYHGFHMRQHRHWFRTILLLLSLFILTFQPQHLRAATVITTLPPLASLVTWLDPKLDVHCLLPRNADPHHFQLTPRQVESLQQGQLLIRSSVDDGHWPSLNSSIPTLDLWPRKQPITTHAHEHDGDGEYKIQQSNHNWLNPQAVSLILPKLAKQLISHFPDHQSIIQAQLAIALKQSDMLWLQWQSTAQSQDWHHKGVMMQHPSWRTIFKALDVPIRAILESEQHGHEYGPKKLEQALQILQQHPQTLLISDKNHSNRTLQWLHSHHSNIAIISLDALGSCKQAWPALMQQNLKQLNPAHQH